MMKLLQKIDCLLFPKQERNHYIEYIWLVYLAIFFTSLYYYHPIKYSLFYAVLGTFLFLVVYFNGYNTSANKIKWNILAILIIGSFMTALTPGASIFFVYAAAFCCRLGNTKKAVIGLIIVSIWIVSLVLVFKFSVYFYIPALLYSLIIGAVNIYQYTIQQKDIELLLSQNEVKHLAKISERERIARDLHDLIGHTFSVITLKAELAGKLIDSDNKKAKNEILEVETISREALKQIREVVTGYRSSDLNTELAHAKHLLESHNIHFTYEFKNFEMKDSINKELAIILKELITNVLKHAKAQRVSTQISLENNSANMKVEDDGIGLNSNYNNGFGLKGIKERVKKLSGSFTIQSNSSTISNTSFMVKIPL
ncbi:integral membrane sensor signal transduction histidine kinase [hydrothermal vent metagenome]|uniref:Integral membrane sensor signal transduction histidine kinase n=1 Tax=hydrothermal vent metagenome TaxID=652676 RepID=A0A3B0VXD3_9ZZZZ